MTPEAKALQQALDTTLEHITKRCGEGSIMVLGKDFKTDVGTGRGFTYPLQGDVPWEMVADAFDDVGYDGWIAPEVSPTSSAISAPWILSFRRVAGSNGRREASMRRSSAARCSSHRR